MALQRRRGHTHRASGPGRAVDANRLPPNVEGYDPNYQRLRSLRRPRCEGAARQVRLHRPRRRRLARSARRQAAESDRWPRRRRAATASTTSCGKEPRRGRHRGSNSSSRSGRICSRWGAPASCRCGPRRIRARRRTASVRSICSTGRTPAIRTRRASACRSSTHLFGNAAFDAGRPGAPDKCFTRLSEARHRLRAVAAERLSVEKPSSCSRGCRATNTTVLRASMAVLRHRHEAQGGRRLTADARQSTRRSQRFVAQMRHCPRAGARTTRDRDCARRRDLAYTDADFSTLQG